jgi:23S rRNA pseudouridine1911/1915/1917 synthase
MKDPVIIFEDADILVVNKPSGLLVHKDGMSEESTLVDWLLKNYPDVAGVGEEMLLRTGERIARPGIVHRLDKDTSGVLLVARTQKMFLYLKELFKNRKIQKEYRAFVHGNIKEDRGVINRPIGKSKKDFRQWSAQRGARGKMREAVTEFTVLARSKEVYPHTLSHISSHSDRPQGNMRKGVGATYLSVFPKTGRTHQIRVHLKAIHHPVVCDPLYASNHDCALSFDRLALHAYQITFVDQSGTERTYSAPLPEDFLRAEEYVRALDK